MIVAVDIPDSVVAASEYGHLWATSKEVEHMPSAYEDLMILRHGPMLETLLKATEIVRDCRKHAPSEGPEITLSVDNCDTLDRVIKAACCMMESMAYIAENFPRSHDGLAVRVQEALKRAEEIAGGPRKL